MISEVNLFGPLAHLVERFHGMEEVTGSIPVWSTALAGGEEARSSNLLGSTASILKGGVGK